ncbi:MAG: diguanylate cyclase [Thermoanaerobaculia bacterium]|nr:diguanylate cyclase [Thermoanaerobaculia bacterium]
MRIAFGRTRWCLLLLSILVAWTLPVNALDPERAVSQYGLDSWSTEEGLPQSTVTGIVQGPDGYLWVATLEGVARFDGIRFRPVDLEALAKLGNRVVTALAGGADGRVWVGTLGGDVVWSTAQDSERVDKPSGGSAGRVWALHHDASDRLWVATGSGLWRLEGGRSLEIAGLEGLAVQAIVAAGVEDHWLATSEGLRHLKDGQLTAPLPQVDATIRTVLRDRQGALWLGTTSEGLYRWHGEELRRWTTAEGLPHDHVNALFEDREGILWIATRGGLVRREGDGFSTPILPTVNVLALQEDSEGSLWLGTQTAGLNRLRNRRITPIGVPEGLNDEVVTTVTAEGDGGWIGTTTGGLHRLTPEARAQPVEHPLPSQRVLAALATEEALWIATDLGLVERSEAEDRFFGIGEVLPQEVVLSLYEDREHRIWAGTNGGGVGVWDGTNWRVLGPGHGLSSGTVYAIGQDQEGAIWLGTQSGLTRLEGDENLTATQVEELAGTLVISLHVDQRGVVWAGTFDGGLARLEGARVSRVTKEQGLYNDTIYSLLVDDTEGLWMCSSRGVFRVALSGLDAAAADPSARVVSRALDRGDGMPASECNGGNQPAAALLADGRMAFTTLHGLALLEPSNLEGQTPPTPVAIEELRADGRTFAAGTTPRLLPGTRQVEIDYTALSFLNPNRIRFRYRLVGYDTTWTEAGARRTAFFTGLGPGDYRLEVVASGHDGAWGTTAASLPFFVEPYFWQTRWFPALLLILLTVAVFSGLRWRLRQFRARQQELERQVAERTDQLAAANRELALLAAQDGLTGLANHRSLQEHLQREWRRGQRDGSPLSFLLLDLDSFKLFNDTYGHQAGDDCLRRTAAVLTKHARRPADLAARYGGEELALVLPDIDATAAAALGESIRQAIENLAIEHRESAAGKVTVSIGAATAVPDSDDSVETLIAAADAALYGAKAAGRNRLVSASD